METVALEWTVLTWNLQGAKRTDVDRVCAAIRQQTPDIVVLQEVRRPQAARLGEALGMRTEWVFKHHFFRPLFPGRAEGAAILTPHTIRSHGSEPVSDATSQRSYKRRILQWATIERDDASGYRVYNTHLSPQDLARERRDEAARVASIVESHGESPPAVIAGDFNDDGEPDIIATLPGIEHEPAPPTNPTDHPVQALDHVLLPPDAVMVSTTVPGGGREWAELSDHLPVTVRFSLDWVQGGFAS